MTLVYWVLALACLFGSAVFLAISLERYRFRPYHLVFILLFGSWVGLRVLASEVWQSVPGGARLVAVGSAVLYGAALALWLLRSKSPDGNGSGR
jgi:hypothetical protein